MMPRFDFPFSGEDSYAAMPWVIGFMVFLTVLFSSMSFNITRMVTYWQKDFGHVVTLHVPVETSEAMTRRDKMVASLQKLKGIRKVHVLQRTEIDKLLAPWLGDTSLLEVLPVPSLIEVEIDKESISGKELASWVKERFPEVQIDDHALWLEDFNRVVRSASWLGVMLVVVITLVTALVVVMATRTELSLHHDTLELLRSLGAENTYIALQFMVKSVWMGAQGVLFGAIAGLVTLSIMEQIASSIEAPFLPIMDFSYQHWLLTLLIGVMCLGLVIGAAKITVMRQLKADDA